MPLREYECADCHRRLEKIQKFSDPELTVCPHCGGPLARTITAPAFQFAGGGWYKDGYASAKPAESASASAGGSASGAGESSGGGGTSAAPASAAPAAPAPSSAPAAPSTKS